MRYYIYTMVIFLLLLMAPGVVAAGGPAVTVPVPSTYMLSGSAKATDDGSNMYSPGPGPITFSRHGEALYVRVPAPACNGTRLISLEDRETGIVFRNNTMLLPPGSGEQAGSLVVTTGNLSAESDGYAGQVTGLELRLTGGQAMAGGTNYTAGAIILLRDLTGGGGYRVSFADDGTVEEAITSELEARGRAIAAISPVFSIEGTTPASEDAAGYLIVTILATDDEPGTYDASNTTLYRYKDSRLSAFKPQVIRAKNGTMCQAIVSGTGQFALVAARPPGSEETGASVTDAGSLAIIGGVMAILLLALAAMVRRVTKR
ncbi:MAG: hypothetical protein A4E28_00855 [Methanocella sp. PtaU1.Bin125]|nr:MAG: hypothetical protein A4E28_00855 [Methanocella sp. PtaU1.Bin125]